MSNVESSPAETTCRTGEACEPDSPQAGGVPVELLSAREVPLGGPRAMTVRRTLPQRQRSLIGPWCFVDHYGPSDVAVTGGMDVAPHPHTGLQTVSWLFSGTIEHIDSGGHTGLVRPGEVNLMTAGAGICHSEVSTARTTVLHGVQLWLALPEAARHTAARSFENHAPQPVRTTGAEVLVFLGELLGTRSPVHTFSPVLGAEIRLVPGARLVLPVDPAFEHGVLVDTGEVSLEGVAVPTAHLAYTGTGSRELVLENRGTTGARVLLLGGEPFGEELVMWWNFLARSHEEIRAYRQEWEDGTERFGEVAGYVGHGGPGRNAAGLSRLPAPRLPEVRMTPRRNPPPAARPEP